MSPVAHVNRRRRAMFAAFSGLLVATASLFVSVVPAAAYDFTIGGCSYSSLIADIEAANSEGDYPGGDTINLAGSCTFLPSPAYGDTVFAFPPITSDIIIDGHGARIELPDGADARSFFDVEPGGNLLLANVTLAEAVGSGSIAASLQNGGSATVSNVTITHSIPTGQGAPAIVNEPNAVLAVIGSTIEFQLCVLCRATSVYNQGLMTMTGSTISRAAGVPAVTNEGTASIYSSTFTDNIRTAVRNKDGALDVHDSTFVDNGSLSTGAAIENTGASDLTVEGSYFEANEASSEGGAIFNGPEAIAQLVNSTFWNNEAANGSFACCINGEGGAISNHHSLTAAHLTFGRNGSKSGASIASPEGILAIKSSVFEDRRGGPHCSGTIVDNGSNVIDDASGCPATFTVGDARLRTPAVNGSGTKTAALASDSAAFDAVPTLGCPTYDQRGVLRPVGAACDAGAFEDRRPNVPGAPALTLGSNPTNGGFSLGWTAATDPDGTPPGYRLFRRDADDAHDTQIGTPTTNSVDLAAEPEGTLRYSVASDDGNLISSKSALSASIVVDRTAPSAPARSADRSPEGGAWFRDTVTVTFSGSTDPDLPDGSPGSGVAFITSPITVSTSGVHPLTGVAGDAAGNESEETLATVRVDAEDPTVAFAGCPRDVTLLSAASAAWSASDPSSGISGATSGDVPLDTSSLGSRSASVTVSDLVGHEATATCDYRVIYDFSGFFAPLANPPKLVDARAGDTISIVFGLGGDQGLGVLAATPVSAPIDCVTPGEPTGGDPTTAARSLSYQTALGGRYRYQWVTPKAWKGTCRQVIVSLIDGTTHRANVRFK